jgi:hypothetical protein
MIAQMIPQCVSIRVTPSLPAGLAVSLRFHMNRKNHFSYILFTDANGAAEVRNDRLLAAFDGDRAYFLMDYVDPRQAFTGEITAEIMSIKKLKGAVDAYEMFKGYSYPEGYIEKIKFALSLGEQASSHKVEVYA